MGETLRERVNILGYFVGAVFSEDETSSDTSSIVYEV